MWLLFTPRMVIRLIVIAGIAGILMGFRSESCHSSVITIQVGQNAPQTWRDEQPSQQEATADPMMGSVTLSYGQTAIARLSAMDGLPVFPQTDYALVYDGSAPIPETETWVMILIGGLLVGARIGMIKNEQCKRRN